MRKKLTTASAHKTLRKKKKLPQKKPTKKTIQGKKKKL